MIKAQATVDLVIFTDESGNRYAFTPEQLAHAKLIDGGTSNFSVRSQLVSVGSELNGCPDGRW